MKPLVIHLLVFLLLVGTWGLGEAVEPLKLYDDFQLGPVNPDKWVGVEFGSAVREAARTIILDPLDPLGRNLRIFARSYGETASDAGASLGAFDFAFRFPSTITAIRARIQVRNFKSTSCPSNPTTPTFVVADTFGHFFNAGTPIPGSHVDDVFASMGVGRFSNSTDPPGVLRVNAIVVHCHDVNCLDQTLLSVTPLGTVTTGQWVKLLMQWDQANHQFIFQRGTLPPVSVPYFVSDTAEPGLQSKDLEVVQFVANCTAAPRPVGMVDALFDNVFVNQSAQP